MKYRIERRTRRSRRTCHNPVISSAHLVILIGLVIADNGVEEKEGGGEKGGARFTGSNRLLTPMAKGLVFQGHLAIALRSAPWGLAKAV